MTKCPASWTEAPPPETGDYRTCPSCGAPIKVIDQGERGVIPAHEEAR